MRSIGARQGALCFGYFNLGKQIKVARAAARNPKSIEPGSLIQNTAVPGRESFGPHEID
jgi:hypothetical protein